MVSLTSTRFPPQNRRPDMAAEKPCSLARSNMNQGTQGLALILFDFVCHAGY